MFPFLTFLAVVSFTRTNSGLTKSQPSLLSSASSALLAAAATPVGSPALENANYVRTAVNLRHWDKAAVDVYVDTTGDTSKTPQQIKDSVAKGLALWNAKLSGMVQLAITDDKSDADIVLSFVAPSQLTGGAVGKTDVSYRIDDQVLLYAAIYIDSGLKTAELVQVSAHELGHALGIEGHSPDKRDLMYAYAHLPAEITDRDLNTMEVSYKPSQAAQPVSPVLPTVNFTAANANTGRASHAATGLFTQTDSAAEFAALAGH